MCLQERLTFVVMGLLRQGKLHFLAALRESLLAFLKAKVKGIISGYLQMEQSGEEPPSIAECMRTMTFQAWMELLSEVFDRMLHCQRAVQVCVCMCVSVFVYVCVFFCVSCDKNVSLPTYNRVRDIHRARVICFVSVAYCVRVICCVSVTYCVRVYCVRVICCVSFAYCVRVICCVMLC